MENFVKMCTTTYLESVFTEDFVKLTNTIHFCYDFTENFVKMCTTTNPQCGNFEIFPQRFFCKNFVKATFLLKSCTVN